MFLCRVTAASHSDSPTESVNRIWSSWYITMLPLAAIHSTEAIKWMNASECIQMCGLDEWVRWRETPGEKRVHRVDIQFLSFLGKVGLTLCKRKNLISGEPQCSSLHWRNSRWQSRQKAHDSGLWAAKEGSWQSELRFGLNIQSTSRLQLPELIECCDNNYIKYCENIHWLN